MTSTVFQQLRGRPYALILWILVVALYGLAWLLSILSLVQVVLSADLQDFTTVDYLAVMIYGVLPAVIFSALSWGLLRLRPWTKKVLAVLFAIELLEWLSILRRGVPAFVDSGPSFISPLLTISLGWLAFQYIISQVKKQKTADAGSTVSVAKS